MVYEGEKLTKQIGIALAKKNIKGKWEVESGGEEISFWKNKDGGSAILVPGSSIVISRRE